MDYSALWLKCKNLLGSLITYVLPLIATVLSILSHMESRKIGRLQFGLNQLEEKLKIYELEEIERRRKDANRADVEARIIEFSKNDYRMKIWNSGQATAYNVDIEVPDECKGIVWRNKVPYEVLESGKSFEERVIVYDTIPRKFWVRTIWADERGIRHSREQIVTI